jgi:DNA-binding NarL/FixJ family response regulator
MGVVDDLNQAREAYERQEWVAAYQALSDLDAPQMRADDFSALATTAYLLGRRNDCVQALQRAFQAHLDAHDDLAAARSALWLAVVLLTGGEPAVGGGWAARAERILDGVDGDVVERGYALAHTVFRHLVDGEYAEALEVAGAVADYGERYRDPDLLALALNVQGRVLTEAGQVGQGVRLMDEAMVGLLAGEVSPIIAGLVYCALIEACVLVRDYGRVAEWTRALTTWCDAQPGLVAFTGQCAVHRGQLMRLHGAYADALDELAQAMERYARAGGDPAVGLAHLERGEVLRLMGEYDAAETAYAAAARTGDEALPGRTLLWLARGRPEAAAGAVRRLVDETVDPVGRIPLLPAAVEVLIAVGAVDEAAPLADELDRIAAAFGGSALAGAAGDAAARVALARGDATVAVAAARSATAAWAELSAPSEVACGRVLLGRALRLQGDEHTATTELVAARDSFAAIGARPAEREAAELLGGDVPPGGLSPREVEVLRLVAAGMTNAEIAAELVLAEKTVARHLSNIFTKLGVGSRTAAAAFAFEHDLAPSTR